MPNSRPRIERYAERRNMGSRRRGTGGRPRMSQWESHHRVQALQRCVHPMEFRGLMRKAVRTGDALLSAAGLLALTALATSCFAQALPTMNDWEKAAGGRQ